jgi:hypothetical protein
LSVNIREPIKIPGDRGEKLIGKTQEAPAARVSGADELELTSGQVPASVLSRVKFAVMLGLSPVEGTGRVKVALPMFVNVTSCG